MIFQNKLFCRVLLCGAVASSLVACKKEAITSYDVPKETPSAPPMMMASAPGESPAQPKVKWTLPAGWTEQQPQNMRVGSFHFGTEPKQGDVSIIPLPGSPGMDKEIVSMWRQELALPPLADADFAATGVSTPVDGGTGKLFEFMVEEAKPGPNVKRRTIAALFQRGPTLWSIKMTGEDGAVSENKPKFIAFLESLAFVDAPETRMASAQPAASEPSAGATAGGGAPPNWQAKSPGPMLLAAYTVSGANGGTAEVTISRFGGPAGGLLANVNRWRGQLGLQPISEAELPGAVSPLEVGGNKGNLIDLKGKNAKTGQDARMIAVALPKDGQTWFYKLMGDDHVVGQERENLIKFIKSAQ